MPFITRFETHTIELVACGWVNLLTLKSRWNFREVSAPCWRLYWNDRSGAWLQSRGQKYQLTPRQLLLVPPHLTVSTFNHLPIRHFHVHFRLMQPTLTLPPQTLLVPLTEPGQTLLTTAITCLRRRSRERALSFVLRALIEWSLSEMAAHAVRVPPGDSRLTPILVYIEQHLDKRLHNRELARQAGMSCNAFTRLFRAQCGVTPHAYILRKRIEQASLMLQFSRVSLEQVAAQTGFCDRYHFSRVFKRLMGVAPAEFRRQVGHQTMTPP